MLETNSKLAVDKDTGNSFDAMAVFIRLNLYLKRSPVLLKLAIVFMIATALTEASFAALMKPIINEAFVNASPWYLTWVPVLVLTVMVTRAVFGFFANYTMQSLGRHVIFDIRQDVFASLINLPTTYFDQNSSAKNVSKLIYDVETTAVTTTDALTIVFKDAVVACALICWLVYLDWRLTCLLYTSPSPRDLSTSRMPSSA